MSDLQRPALRHPPANSRLSSTQSGRKLAIYFLAVLIVSVMVVWFGFLGWGFVAILQRALDWVKDFWIHP
jgi:type VI protein secretion system component VasF